MNESPEFPRLLVVDPTRVGSLTATGQVKRQLLRGWPPDRLLQVWWEHEVGLGWALGDGPTSQGAPPEHLIPVCRAFAPEVVYHRPLDTPAGFVEPARHLVAAFPDTPLAVHLMDDWPERLRADAGRHAEFDAELRTLLDRAGARFSISPEMADEFARRYGTPFEPFANCVDPVEWTDAPPDRTPLPGTPTPDQPFVLRYSGALAGDMTRLSVLDLAEAVETVAADLPIRFEVATFGLWYEQARRDFAHLPSTHVSTADRTDAEYRGFLRGADAGVVAYNFDDASRRYVAYSIANKIPEYLAAGRPLLVYGPPDYAGVRLCSESGGALLVGSRDRFQLEAALHTLAQDPELRKKLGSAGREHIFAVANATEVRARFRDRLRALAAGGGATTMARPPTELLVDHPRDAHLGLDEVKVAATLLAHYPRDSIMIDVGAHQGSSARPFLDLGWRVFGFEPDPANREILTGSLGDHPRLVIDDRAVSDQARDDVPFYVSEESTGISALAAFHESHREGTRVRTTTLADFCRQRHIDHVDFLKVDVEGHDLFVLKGNDWDRIRPDVILCEFEDRKTEAVGYRFDDLASFLTDRGYDVWVSEWHPVIRYGIAHDWRGLAHSPYRPRDPAAWGNLLAFAEPVGADAVRMAFAAAATPRTPATPRTTTTRETPMGAPVRTRPAKAQGKGPKPAPAKGTAKKPPEAALARHYRRQMGGLRRLVRDVLSACRGKMLLPVGGAGLCYGTAFVAGAAGVDSQVVVPLVAAGGGLTTLAVALGVVTARRERDQKGAAFRQAVVGVVRTVRRANDRQAGKLQKRFQAAERAMTRLSNQMEKAEKSQVRRLTSLEERFEHRALELHRLGRSIAAFEERAEALEQAVQTGGRHPFDRNLTPDQVADLAGRWAELLDVPVDERHLAYLAERVRVAEHLCHGRLATNTHDMLLRMMTARAALSHAADRSEPLHILEIGVLFGIGTGLLYDACAGFGGEVTVTGVDPLEGYYAPGTLDLITGIPVTHQVVERNLDTMQIPPAHRRLVQELSLDASRSAEAADRKYGLVVIDADHTYQGVKTDFEAWRPLMPSGGYVVFDDYGSPHWPDIQTYVDEEVRPRDDVEVLGSSSYTAVVRVK